MSLWRQAGELLGYHSLLNYGYSENGSLEDGSYSNIDYSGSSDSSIAYSPTEKQSAPPVQVAVSAAPVININGNQSDSDIVNTIRSHIRDLADDMCGEIADKITVVFSDILE